MTRSTLRPLIERCAAEAASKFGAMFAEVLGTGTSRECVFARREAIRNVLAESRCSYRALADAWGIDPQMVRRAVEDAEPMRPFSINDTAAARAALSAKLAWQYGPDRAMAILAGTDPQTQADIARWNALGSGSAA